MTPRPKKGRRVEKNPDRRDNAASSVPIRSSDEVWVARNEQRSSVKMIGHKRRSLADQVKPQFSKGVSRQVAAPSSERLAVLFAETPNHHRLRSKTYSP